MIIRKREWKNLQEVIKKIADKLGYDVWGDSADPLVEKYIPAVSSDNFLVMQNEIKNLKEKLQLLADKQNLEWVDTKEEKIRKGWFKVTKAEKDKRIKNEAKTKTQEDFYRDHPSPLSFLQNRNLNVIGGENKPYGSPRGLG